MNSVFRTDKTILIAVKWKYREFLTKKINDNLFSNRENEIYLIRYKLKSNFVRKTEKQKLETV